MTPVARRANAAGTPGRLREDDRPGTSPWPSCETCGQPLRPQPRRCRCRHIETGHDLRRDGSRGACGRIEGPRGVPCGCKRFELDAGYGQPLDESGVV